MKFLTLVLILCFAINMTGYTQNKAGAVSPVFGFHQWDQSGIELGVSRSIITGEATRITSVTNSYTHAISSELYFTNDVLVAPKYSFWLRRKQTKSLIVGSAVVGYTSLNSPDSFDWKIRPQVGFCYPNPNSKGPLDKYKNLHFKLTYSYNINVVDPTLEEVSPHLFSLIIYREGNVDKRAIKHSE